MKEKIAPIHFMQHNRIRIQENLERYLIDMFSLQDLDRENTEHYGERTSEEALENQIDHDNIHGWLESHVIGNEKRLAALAGKIIETSDEETLILAYAEYGRRVGESLKGEIHFSNGQELYGYLNALLLDGMPCDKINVLAETDENHLVWHNVRDIHGRYFEELGLQGNLFYILRQSFMTGFLSAIGNIEYSLDIMPEFIVNSVTF
ncbi:hypothetical protein [Proteiniclasticum sp.]|uniref:hypothetical protein n=1 Tax=Proteiniclasticum sp. TaxID=2053595 RepID=UPI00289B83D5|nr:hypothetical protein [Proteiniclasticum sp.]